MQQFWQHGDTRTLRQLIVLVFQLAIHGTLQVAYAALLKYLADHGSSYINANNNSNGNVNILKARPVYVQYILDRAHYEFAELWNLTDGWLSSGDHSLRDKSKVDLTKAIAGAQEYLERHGLLRSKGRFQHPKLSGQHRYNFIKFLHQLCKSQVLTEDMIHGFIGKLFQIPSPDHKDVHCLHHLLSLVKEKIHPYAAGGYVKNHLSRMEELAKDVKLSFHAHKAIMVGYTHSFV